MNGSVGGSGPLILEVKGNSLDDGPGIRTVIFFKGCPLSCAWCHNPESRRTGVEISFDPSECVSCDACVEACGRGALDRSNPAFIDRGKCDLCFECVEVCPSGALGRVGKQMQVGELLAGVEKDIPFYRTSGGGVTLSGGEPTMFMEYASELLRGLERLGVNTIVETCGQFELEEFLRLVYPYTDCIYYDLKISDEERHRRFCGTGNRRILANFEELHSRYLAGGVEVLPRIPLVPGITSTDENLSRLAGFLEDCGASRVALLPYNPLWLDKSRKIGEENPLCESAEYSDFMTRTELERCRSFFDGFSLV